MANITTALTGYPTALDTRTTLTDGASGDAIVAAHPNGVASAVIAAQTALGVTPQGTAATVVARLDVTQTSDGTPNSQVILFSTIFG